MQPNQASWAAPLLITITACAGPVHGPAPRLTSTAGGARVVALQAGTLSQDGVPSRTDRASPDPSNTDPARAGDPSSLDSLEGCLASAALRNPGLEAAFERWRAASAAVGAAGTLPDPRLTYKHFIDEVETRVGAQERALGIAQMIPLGGKRRLERRMAEEQAEVLRQHYERERFALSRRVKDAWFEHAYLARAIAIAKRDRDFASYLEEVVRSRYRTAAAGQPDVIRANIELARANDRLRSLEDRRTPIRARLNAALDRPSDAPLPDPGSHADRSIELLGFEDDWLHEAIRDANPVLKALEHTEQKSRYASDLADKQRVPDLTLGLDYIDTAGALMAGTPDSGKDPLALTLSINLPIQRGRLSSAGRAARAEQRAATLTRVEAGNRVTAEAEFLLFELRDAERKLALYGDELIPKAEQELAGIEAAFRTGDADFLDLVQAKRDLFEFELVFERAWADHGGLLGALEELAGRTLPTRPAELIPARSGKQEEER